ncbi:MAG: hypothetical protein HQK91_02340 [Nitrospirae bacterium]|nr:hypothetical protein [Nitrospirota bacterium]MBF0540273.1 hypothetical protein [Nitrospirota bacterium]
MPLKTVNIPIEPIINLLKSLDNDFKDEIFNRVFIENIEDAMTAVEKKAVSKAEIEFKTGKTKKWPFVK